MSTPVTPTAQTLPYQNWHFTTDADHILWLSLDRQNSPVNSINAEILLELDQLLDYILQQPELSGVVIQSAKSSGFIAGADIQQFVAVASKEQTAIPADNSDEGVSGGGYAILPPDRAGELGSTAAPKQGSSLPRFSAGTAGEQTDAFELIRKAQLVLDKLAALGIPTVAMIKGFCLGGGLELALACRYRVADEDAKTILGAPEVNLGLHPGWGGTVRLPRLIGVLPAMQMNLTGKPVNAKTAAKLGLIDIAVPERHLVQAARYCLLQKPLAHQPVFYQKWLNEKFLRPWVAKILYKQLQKKVNKAHYPAPYAIVENWVKENIYTEAAMVLEAKSIAHLMMGDTSRNLVRDFFLQTRLKGLAKNTKASFKHVHVIGAGVMGGDIAAWCALKGLTVTLQDRLPDLISPAIKRAAELFQKKLKTPRLVQAALDRLIPDVAGVGVSKADVVIEAVSENLTLKQSIYQSLEAHLKPDAILATNTSSLALEELSKILKNPARLVGIHFFNPVAMMQLVEVVQANNTDPDAVQKAIAFVRRIDRLPLPVQSCPGFLVNRVLMPYLMEAMVLLDEGYSPETIDQAALDFGMPMGPIELADTVGLDVCLAVAENLAPHTNIKISNTLQQKITTKDLGRKTGKGFYVYRKGKPVKSAPKAGYEALTDKLILPMVNEALACVREKIVADGDLADAGMIFGTGFAPFRGGPVHYAREKNIEA